MSETSGPRYVPEDSLKSPRFTGIRTFARLPHVRTLEDVDVAVIGSPFDTGVSFRAGGRFGPSAIRAASALIRGHNPVLDVNPFHVLSCVDYGDVPIIPGYIERSYEVIERELTPVVEAGVIPLLLGGDHSVTLPHLRATRSVGPVAVIMFDSHTDAWDSFFGEKYNHGTWMRRAIEEGLVDVDHSIEVGLRGSVYGPEDWTMLKDELGLDYMPTVDILSQGTDAAIERIREPRRRPPRVHQLRHRHGRSGVRAGHGDARGRRPLVRPGARDRSRAARHRLRGLRRGGGHPGVRLRRSRRRSWQRTSDSR